MLQEASIEALRSDVRFESEAHELAWLHRVVYRCSPDLVRRTPADEAWRGLSDNDRAVLLLVDRVRCGGGHRGDAAGRTAAPGSPASHATGELPKLPPGYEPVPAVDVVTGESATLLTFAPSVSGYQLDGSRCAAPRIVFRVRMTSDSEGIPLRAQVLIVRRATSTARRSCAFRALEGRRSFLERWTDVPSTATRAVRSREATAVGYLPVRRAGSYLPKGGS